MEAQNENLEISATKDSETISSTQAEISPEEAEKEAVQSVRNYHYFSPGQTMFGVWQNWAQKWIDMQEFFLYANVSKYKKPEWVTPNEIVGDIHCFKVRKFSTKTSDAIPTLVLPPFAGHYSTIADYAENQSLVKHLMDYGVENVHSLDYHSADEDMKNYDIDNYLAQLNAVVDDLGEKVNLIGLCQGGWFGAIYTARFPKKVQTLVAAGAPIDTCVGGGYLTQTVAKSSPSFYSNLVRMGKGVMDGRFLLMGFKNMNPEKHYWEKYTDLYEKVTGLENDEEGLERFERFEVWYENTLSMPGKWYKQVIEELFRNNNFIKGKFKALGKIVDPKDITCPTYLLGGEKDDITLPEQVHDAEKYFGTPKDKVAKGLAKAGHIGLFMGRSVLTNNWKEIAEWMLKYQKN